MTSHRLTAEQLDAAACEWAERTAREQGLPVGIEDPVWLDRLATFMTSTSAASPAAGRSADAPPSPLGQSPRAAARAALTTGDAEQRPTSPEAA